MRCAVLLFALVLPAATPAFAQSCATLGGQVDCKRPGYTPRARTQLPSSERKSEVQGSAEATISNRGTSTTMNNRVIDSHGVMEFEFRASKCESSGRRYPVGCY